MRKASWTSRRSSDRWSELLRCEVLRIGERERYWQISPTQLSLMQSDACWQAWPALQTSSIGPRAEYAVFVVAVAFRSVVTVEKETTWMAELLQFYASTPFGFSVRCTRRHWEFLVRWKHPILEGRSDEVRKTLEFPEHLRRSRSDPAVLLFYRRHERRWLCAVVRVAAGTAFLVTAYPTDALKAGETLWTLFE